MVSRGSKYIVIGLVIAPNQTYERYLQVTKNKSKCWLQLFQIKNFLLLGIVMILLLLVIR